jgi:hypothetical protein
VWFTVVKANVVYNVYVFLGNQIGVPFVSEYSLCDEGLECVLNK